MSTLDRNEASLRSQYYATRPISRDNLVPEDPALGLVAFASPFDPEPSLRIEDGRIVELDGKPEAEFDLIDEFVARRGIDLEVAPEAMALDTLDFARLLVDPGVPRREITRLVAGMTPAKIAATLALLTPVEILQAMQKMRVRRTPSIQAHVTNRVDHPLLIAADAASAVAHGFRELETTVPVLRDAPSNALALLVGSQVAAAGALTQCSVEEATELELGMRGLTTYAETVSVYGTEQVFVDGDDTPWSKAFLASCYASRGLKMRFTSGSGAEVLMGETEGKSMLYLEARCIAVTRAAGAQGVQNGGIDGVNVTASVPDGMREVIAENLCVMLHDLESCTGNDTLMSASDIRRTAHTLPLLLAGSDFLFSGFGSIPAYDNAFGPSNFNAEDLDDYLVIQRDWGFEGGLRSRPRRRAAALSAPGGRGVPGRLRRARAGVVRRRGRRRLRRRARLARRARAARRPRPGCRRPDHGTGRDGPRRDSRARSATGTRVEAERVLEMLRQRLLGDFLQTSAIFDEDMNVLSNLTDPNDYAGPGTGYRMSPSAAREVARVRQVWSPADLAAEQALAAGCLRADGDRAGAFARATRRGRRRALARLRRRDLGRAERDDRRRGAAPGARRHRGGGAREPTRPGVPLDRSRHDRLDGRAALRLGHLGRPPGEGHGAHPPRRPAAARQPRALLDRAARDRRALPRPRPQRRALREGRPASSRCSCRSRASRSGRGTTRGSSSSWPSSAGSPRPTIPSRWRRRGRADVSALRRRSRRAIRRRAAGAVSEITLERVLAGEIGPDDVRVSPDTLRLQADFAEQGGNPQLAENLRRGAELVAFADDELLALLRQAPAGSLDRGELDELAAALEPRGAPSAARRSSARRAPPTSAVG